MVFINDGNILHKPFSGLVFSFFVGKGGGGNILERFAVIKSLDLPKIWYTNSRIMNLGSVIP